MDITKVLPKSFIVIAILIVISCNNQEIEGIKIRETIYNNQSQREIRELNDAIKKSINKDKSGLIKLINIDCGGGSGCYDLGFIISQIIYKIGEVEFAKMAIQFDKNKIESTKRLINAGLEYGDNDYDGKKDNKSIEKEFPYLNKILTLE